jgi:hypothetical protein
VDPVEHGAGQAGVAPRDPRSMASQGRPSLCTLSRTEVRAGVCGVGPHCSFCGTFTGPFSEVEGLFTVLICIPCLEVRQAQPDTLLGLHDPGGQWFQWGCPIKGCGKWFIGPWDLEGAHRGRASRLDGHLRAAAALSESAHAGRLPPRRAAAGELT